MLRRLGVLALILASFSAAASVAVPDDTTLLPQDGSFDGWTKSDPPKRFVEADLYGYIDGGAELFLEYGFEQLTVQKYRKGADEFAVELYRMTDAPAATGIYLMKAGKETPAAGFRERHTANKYQLTFCRNRYFVIVNNLSGREALAPIEVAFASYIASKLPPPTPVPELKTLPPEALVPGSARLVRGAYGLQSVYTLGEGDILLLERKRIAVTGDYKSATGTYTLILADYTDAAQAKRAFDHLQKNLDRYLKVVDQKSDRFVFEDFAKKFGVATVRGRRLEIRVKLPGKPPPQVQRAPVPAAVVLARSGSPYRSLAQEIAGQEAIPLVDSVADAVALRPAFLLWVVAPAELSDVAVTNFNLTLERAPVRPSAGVITGSTLAHARDLYARARQTRGESADYADSRGGESADYADSRRGARTAVVLGQLVFTRPQVIEAAGPYQQSRSLSRAADVVRLFERVDYLHYAGHGSSGDWRPLTNDWIGANDVPRLAPIVISTMSCQTTRIWEHGSIALRMVDQGAAAYSGFYYSPMAGYQIGEHDGPFRQTSPEVPIGYVIEAMNEGARKSYAAFSFHLLLGDPRIALRSEAPCQLLDNGDTGGVRTVSCSGAPSGLVPVRIRGGARYRFVEIAGGTAVWDSGPFFNRRAQTTTIGEDRIVLVEHHGGDLRMTLRQRPPVTWLATVPLVDGLDDLLISAADRRHGGDLLACALGAAAMIWVALRARKRRSDCVFVITAATIGLIAALMHGAYGLVRHSAVVVIAKDLVISPLAPVGTGILAACGALVFLSARTWRGRVLGTVTATSVGWAAGGGLLAMTTVTNVAIAGRTSIGVWIYRVSFHPFILSALGCAVYAVVFSVAARIVARRNAGGRPLQFVP